MTNRTFSIDFEFGEITVNLTLSQPGELIDGSALDQMIQKIAHTTTMRVVPGLSELIHSLELDSHDEIIVLDHAATLTLLDFSCSIDFDLRLNVDMDMDVAKTSVISFLTPEAMQAIANVLSVAAANNAESCTDYRERAMRNMMRDHPLSDLFGPGVTVDFVGAGMGNPFGTRQ